MSVFLPKDIDPVSVGAFFPALQRGVHFLIFATFRSTLLRYYRTTFCLFFSVACLISFLGFFIYPSQGFYVVGISSFSSAPNRSVRYGMVQLHPFFFKDENGIYKGYMPDLLALLAQNEGWRLSLVEAPGDELVQMLQNGEIDLLSMAPTPRLEKLFDFGKEHHYATWYTFFTRQDLEVLTFRDLEGRKISMQAGFFALSELRRILDGIGIRYEIVETKTVDEALEMLRSGVVDVCSAEQLATLGKVRRLSFRRSPVIFATSRIFFATTSGKNAELLARLDKKLAEMNASPLSPLPMLLRRWYYDDEFTFFPQWALWTFFSTAVVLLLVGAGFVVFFKKERRLRLQGKQLQERFEFERFLSEASRMLLSEEEGDDVLRNTCRTLLEVADARRLLLLKSTFASSRRRSVDICFEYAAPGLAHIAKTTEGKLIFVSDIPRKWLIDFTRGKVVKGRLDTTSLKDFFPASEGGYFLFYPLFEGGRFWGTLAINTHKDDECSDTANLLFHSYSKMISAYLLRKRQERRLLRLATTDALTGLPNRRSFFESLSREITRSVRRGRPISLILCDIDIFKNVNDTYGHDVGDEVLRQFARVLRKTVRAEDLPVRYGGEEFGVLLPETDLRNSLQTAERLRNVVEKTRFHIDGGVENSLFIYLTASFGVEEFLGAQDSAAEFFARADRALYEAKTGGRNRVVAGNRPQ